MKNKRISLPSLTQNKAFLEKEGFVLFNGILVGKYLLVMYGCWQLALFPIVYSSLM
jgi:hypothetical protein